MVFALVPLGWTSLLAIPGIVLLFVNGFWVVMVLGYICARFRDVELFVRNLMQLAFFVTPVFWNYRQLATDRKFIVDYNVLFYFIEIIRNPLLGEVPPLSALSHRSGGDRDRLLASRTSCTGEMRGQLAFCV